MKVWLLKGYSLGKYDEPDVIGVYYASNTSAMLHDVESFLRDTYRWDEEQISLPTEEVVEESTFFAWCDEDGDRIAWAWLEEVQ